MNIKNQENMKKYTQLYKLFFLLLFFAIPIVSAKNDSPEYSIDQDVINAELAGMWLIDEIQGVKVYNDGPEKLNIKINQEITGFSGFIGCNRMGGKILTVNNSIDFKNVFATSMVCDMQERELKILNTIITISSYSIVDSKLYLSNNQGLQLILHKG